MGWVRGTVGLATDLVQKRVDMGQKYTNGRGTVTGLTQRTEEEDAVDPQRNTHISNAMLKHVLVCILVPSFSSFLYYILTHSLPYYQW